MMQVLCVIATAAALVCATSVSVVESTRELQAVEATRCSEDANESFEDNLNSSSRGCSARSSYDWAGEADPTDAQRSELCSCDVDVLEVPDCTWMKLEHVVTVAEHTKFVFNCTGKPTPEITIVATPSPSPTPTSSATPTPLSTLSEDDMPRCDDHDMIVFVADLSTASNGCTKTSSYDWAGSVNPTAAQYTELCKCTATTSFNIPRCKVRKGTFLIGLETHYDWVLDQCKTASPSADGVATSSPATNSAEKPTPSTLARGIAICIVFTVVLLGFALVMYNRNRASHTEERDATAVAVDHKEFDPSSSIGSTTSAHTTISTANGSVHGRESASHEPRNSNTGKWDDPVVMAVRIPHESIFFGPLLSRGGFGEVFKGTYKGEVVAIKQLIPEKRKDLDQIDGFLGEVKLMSVLEHERIVKFIGVAWNSLSDACMVVEFMENGDLRSVLNRWDHGDEQRSNGFDADKVKIAMHVAHALTYLHTLRPPVVHRDLKSKNILLDANFDAKLTDFGISRERAESTMTAGVGSSLWMAPEVMLGERYSEKADIFSFGVVLSELDTHQLPYFHAKESVSGQRLPETAILQQVMLGRLSVGFTDRADPDLVELGRECVHLDPKTRPTAAQVLHRVHQVLKRVQA